MRMIIPPELRHSPLDRVDRPCPATGAMSIIRGSMG
jgi:hypothetical protein